MVVAVSEAVLYIIWQSQRSSSKPHKTRRRLDSSRHKKDDGDVHPLPTISTPVGVLSDTGLRRRQ